MAIQVHVWSHDIAFGLRHLGAANGDESTKADAWERFFETHQAKIAERHRHETGVQVMALHVLRSAGIEVHRERHRGAPSIPRPIVELS